MAVPDIQLASSVLEYLQFAPWTFQPVALNSPDYWLCTGLPLGVDFNPATGKISGPAIEPGVWDILLTAGNDDGVSQTVVLSLGIEASSYSAQYDAVDFDWDLGTGKVTAAQAVESKALLADGTAPLLAAICWFKSKNIRHIHVRPRKAGVVMDIEFATLRFSLKAYDVDEAIIVADKFVRVGTGPDTFYRLALDLSTGDLLKALGEYESDAGTELVALGEFEGTHEIGDIDPPITDGPESGTTSSLNFGVGIARHLAPEGGE